MNLLNYAWEIYDMALADKSTPDDDVQVDVALAYFTDNLRDYGVKGDEFHPGAEGLDWVALSAEWKAMEPQVQSAATNAFLKVYNAHKDELNKLYHAGDRAGFEVVIQAAQAE